MSKQKTLTEEEYALATLGRSGYIPSYKEYLEIEERKELLNVLQILKKWNDKPFYPTQKGSFTESFNGYSARQTNQINEIIEKFQKRIKEWDYRE